ncbi:hypothetical protein [Bradyrhizobium sp.]|jgi:hypothetical protein|uniref:hypothetical protein n=1 Tax=Bradyrhizobium sp. TaxID=376 RepID=UPI002DDD62AD|nr:hypothetical protein [Bradyrhizobium sp.]HEV2154445.1 hypothetical protein [Bradyrhizobium sp.]
MQYRIVLLAMLGVWFVHASLATAQDCPNCGNPLAQSQFSQSTTLADGWRLVKSRNPGGGGEIVSVMHAVDTAKSDVGLAGMSLRCGAIGPEVILILLDPVQSAGHPVVTLKAGSIKTQFEASVLQDGRAILLPVAATAVSNAAKRGATEVSITIDTQPQKINGVVPLAGLSSALTSLSVHCSGK